MNWYDVLQEKSVVEMTRKYLPISVTILLMCIIGVIAVACFQCCVDVFRFTLPAIPVAQAAEFSQAAYWSETNLFTHFQRMPASAQAYFLLHGIVLTGCIALEAVLAAIAAHLTENR